MKRRSAKAVPQESNVVKSFACEKNWQLYVFFFCCLHFSDDHLQTCAYGWRTDRAFEDYNVIDGVFGSKW